MQLQEFYDYKNRLMNDLLTTESIVKLIDETKSLKDAPALVYTQVFPYEYVPDTVEDAKTFICCDVDIQKVESKTYLYPVLYIWVFTHKSLLKLNGGQGVRTDKLCSEICKKINGSLFYGLGELDLYAVKRFAPMTDFQGKVMTFHASEINRLHDPKRPVPLNRKLG